MLPGQLIHEHRGRTGTRRGDPATHLPGKLWSSDQKALAQESLGMGLLAHMKCGYRLWGVLPDIP